MLQNQGLFYQNKEDEINNDIGMRLVQLEQMMAKLLTYLIKERDK